MKEDDFMGGGAGGTPLSEQRTDDFNSEIHEWAVYLNGAFEDMEGSAFFGDDSWGETNVRDWLDSQSSKLTIDKRKLIEKNISIDNIESLIVSEIEQNGTKSDHLETPNYIRQVIVDIHDVLVKEKITSRLTTSRIGSVFSFRDQLEIYGFRFNNIASSLGTDGAPNLDPTSARRDDGWASQVDSTQNLADNRRKPSNPQL